MRGLVAPMQKELNTHTHKNDEPTQEVSNTTQEEQWTSAKKIWKPCKKNDKHHLSYQHEKNQTPLQKERQL
jgi:hypothetical protein